MANVGLKGVSKVFPNGVEAVKDFNLEVKDKEFIILVGPSGCGKSTLLRMIAGLEETTKGEISINGQEVSNVPPRDRNIAMVFQNYALYPHMNVYRNMAFGLELKRYPRTEINQRVNEAAEILGIKKLFKNKPAALSGGERQRVAVGRAIVRKPKVFLFDEPLSNLDAKLRVQMRSELNKLHLRLQATIIYVTHDQIEAMTMGDRIVIMKDGVIQQIDDPINVYNGPANKFVAGFIGSPPMNFIDGMIVKKNGDYRFKSNDFSIKLLDKFSGKINKYENKMVSFGVRPEDIYDKVFSADAYRTNSIKANVDIVEPLGSEVYLHLKTGKHNFIARVDPNNKTTENQEIEVVFDMNKIHLFDQTTEKVII